MESATAPSRVDFAVDKFAIGVVAVCLLTGRCPWMLRASSSSMTVFAALLTVLGPITEISWPGHHNLSGWPAFSARHRDSLEAALKLGGTTLDRLAKLSEANPLDPKGTALVATERCLLCAGG